MKYLTCTIDWLCLLPQENCSLWGHYTANIKQQVQWKNNSRTYDLIMGIDIINEQSGKRAAILTNNSSGMCYQCGRQSHAPANKLDFKGHHKESHNPAAEFNIKILLVPVNWLLQHRSRGSSYLLWWSQDCLFPLT